MSEDNKYTFFWAGEFSQWFHSDFEVDGVKYNTALPNSLRMKISKRFLRQLLEPRW